MPTWATSTGKGKKDFLVEEDSLPRIWILFRYEIDSLFPHRCVALWMYALELQQNHLDPFSTMTQSSLYSFAELFSFMLAEQKEREDAAAAGGGWVFVLDFSLCVVFGFDFFFSRSFSQLINGSSNIRRHSESRQDVSSGDNGAAQSDLAQREKTQKTPNIRVKASSR